MNVHGVYVCLLVRFCSLFDHDLFSHDVIVVKYKKRRKSKKIDLTLSLLTMRIMLFYIYIESILL
jgi:hypothetical protein